VLTAQTTQVYAQVTILFKNAHDLLEEFKQFLPDTSGNVPASGGLFNMIAAATPSGTGNISMDVMDGKDKAKKNGTSGGATTSTADKSAASQKRKKRALEKDLAAAPKAGQSKVCNTPSTSIIRT
jgi:paired amphipathic helix protein Sin3a